MQVRNDQFERGIRSAFGQKNASCTADDAASSSVRFLRPRPWRPAAGTPRISRCLWVGLPEARHLKSGFEIAPPTQIESFAIMCALQIDGLRFANLTHFRTTSASSRAGQPGRIYCSILRGTDPVDARVVADGLVGLVDHDHLELNLIFIMNKRRIL